MAARLQARPQGDATPRSVRRAPSPSDGAVARPRRRANKERAHSKGFPGRRPIRADSGVDLEASACVQRTPADVDPHPRSTAPCALGSQAKSLRRAEPVGVARRWPAEARAAVTHAPTLHKQLGRPVCRPLLACAVQGDTLRPRFRFSCIELSPFGMGRRRRCDVRGSMQPREGVHE